MRTPLLFLLLASVALAQSTPANRITFSAGWSREVGGDSFRKQRAPGLGLWYGYRAHKYVEAEAGVFTALRPAAEIRGASYFLDPNDRFIWIPFGIRFIAPLYLNRIEFSGGGGGLYEKYSVSNPNPGLGVMSRTGWGGYFAGATSVALDRGRHVWMGAASRIFLANPAYARDRWLQITLEFIWRF